MVTGKVKRDWDFKATDSSYSYARRRRQMGKRLEFSTCCEEG